MYSLEFEPACIGISTINAYLRTLTNTYIERGYVTTRAYLTPQDLSSSILTIVIVEGELESLRLNEEETYSFDLAIPSNKQEILNLRDVEQGLDQINRLQRYDAQIKMLPGTEPGTTIVDVHTNIGKPIYIDFGFNNGGQPLTGEELLSAKLGGENLLGLFEQWSLTATKASEFTAKYDSESLNFDINVPLGYWNLSYRTAYSTYYTEFDSRGFTIDTDGKSTLHNADLTWLFHRDGQGKSAITLGLTHRRDKNYLMGSLIESGSRALTAASLSLNISHRLLGGYATFSPAFTLGTDWFGGESDSEVLSEPVAQFYKGTLMASMSYPLKESLFYTSSLFAQWSNNTLYGSQRISIGGEYTIRGFKNVSLSGDEGYYWRNDVTWDINRFAYLGQLQAQWAIDTGTIVPDSQDAYENGSLMGTSVAFRLLGQHYKAVAAIGFPIAAPSRLHVDDYVIYYQLNLTY
ncbi:ShlB/FhaC/HecB family hemolysin secretion/activation protein [Vibrio sonorensis]|uniref:ShlB/FhaC/HecB family hemolysin secretion/activation protein n=1 Tax=Vibrio sonorensis TaxID=1004316 RepID=UPI0008DA71B4|nr:ShlB/FhaC/HecB family hemolysin secretion/activation protein [Vibrio sonorensis]